MHESQQSYMIASGLILTYFDLMTLRVFIFVKLRSDGAVGKAFASNCKVAGSSPLPGSNSKASTVREIK